MSTNDKQSSSASLGKIREILVGDQLQELSARLDSQAAAVAGQLEAREQAFRSQLDACESRLLERHQELESKMERLQTQVDQLQATLTEVSASGVSRQDLAQFFRTFAASIETP